MKHQVSVDEVEELFFTHTQFHKAGKGNTKGEDLYQATGQTMDGRYLSVYFIYKPQIIFVNLTNIPDCHSRVGGNPLL